MREEHRDTCDFHNRNVRHEVRGMQQKAICEFIQEISIEIRTSEQQKDAYVIWRDKQRDKRCNINDERRACVVH